MKDSSPHIIPVKSVAAKNNHQPFFSAGGKAVADTFYQPKLSINQPGDQYEQEADAMAGLVVAAAQTEPTTEVSSAANPTVNVAKVSAATSAIQTANNLSSLTGSTLQPEDGPATEEENTHDELPGTPTSPLMDTRPPEIGSAPVKLQRKSTPLPISPLIQLNTAGDTNTSVAPAAVEATIASGGQPLDDGIRDYMEAGFGHDFSNVKIHDDSQAHSSANQVQAHAYTHQNHIAFAAGQYQPETDSGKKLLAHELTHVVQQGGGETKVVQRQLVHDAFDPFSLTPLYSNATTLEGFARDGMSLYNSAGLASKRSIIVFTQTGLDVFSISARRFVAHYRKREGEAWLTASVWIMDTGGGVTQVGYRDSVLREETRQLDPSGFSAERIAIIDERGAISLLDDMTMTTATELNTHNYLPAVVVVGTLPTTSTGEGAGEGTTITDWAQDQTRALTESLGPGTSPNGDGTVADPGIPDRIVVWARQDGRQFLNVWVGGRNRSHGGVPVSVELHEGESPEQLEERVRAATEELRSSRDPAQSTQVADGATETGFTEPPPGARPQTELPGSGLVTDPEQERLRVENADSIANWPPYPARINNYDTNISVSGGNNRMAMEIDYSIAGSDTLSQVAARMQHISYLWEIFNVTNVPVPGERDILTRRSAGSGQVIGAGSGAGNELDRDFSNIYEDQEADLSVMADSGVANIALWPYRSAQLSLMALSSVVRGVGSLVSGFISVLTTPINERNIGWDTEGEFIVRCIATPSYDEDSPNIRASSIAVQPIKVMNINSRAEEEVVRPDADLQNLRSRLATTAPGPERDQLLESIAQAQRIGAQTTMESVTEQATEATQRLLAIDEIIAQMAAGTDPTTMSVRARLLRVQLILNGVAPAEFRGHVNNQLEQIRNLQQYGTQMSNGMRPPLYRPRVVLASEENGQVFQMVTMLGETSASREGSRVYRLVDLTSPNTQDYYEGAGSSAGVQGHSEAINNAFIRFRENNGYGRGTIAIRLPFNMPAGVTVPNQMRSAPGEGGRWIQRLQDLATAAEIAGLIVSGPAGIAIGIAGGVAGAAVAVDSLMRRRHAGRFSWNFQTVMEVTSVIGGVIPFLGLSRRFERTVYFIGIAQLGQSALAIPIQLEEQLRAIEMQLDLPEGERRARRAEAFLQAVRSGAVLVVTARQMAAQGVPAVHESPTSTTRGAGDAPVDSSTSPVREAVEPADSSRATDPDIARPPAETTPGNVEPADSTRPTDPDIVRRPAETMPGDVEPVDSTRPTLPDIEVPRESSTDTEGNADGEPLTLEPGIEDGIRRERGDSAESDRPTPRPTLDETVPGREAETPQEESEADGPTRTTIAPRATEPIIAASQRLRARIAELLGATTLSEHGSEPVRTRQRALQVEGLLRNNPDLTILAHDTIIEIGNFKTIRERMRTSFFGDTPEAILMAQQVLQEVRMQLGDSAIREGLEFANQLYPGLTPRTVDQGTPGFASDRDVTLQFRGGGEGNVNQRIDASMQAVTRAYESLRRRGIEPDAVLDTNFYTELHEASIRPESPHEAAQIIFDQSVVGLAEIRRGMTEVEWMAYREAQLRRLTSRVDADGRPGAREADSRAELEAELDAGREEMGMNSAEWSAYREAELARFDATVVQESTNSLTEADARERLVAELDAAEALSGRLAPVGSNSASRTALLAGRMQALSEAMHRNAPPREIRQLMAEVKFLEPEAYGTRAAVESVVGRQQTLTHGDADTYMSGRSLPQGRVERIAFLSQDASAQLGMLFGHSRLTNADTARSVAKYLNRIVHAVVTDGGFTAGASREFVANLSDIIQTKSITPESVADAAAMQFIRAGLAVTGRSGEAMATMNDAALVSAWVQIARSHGVELVGTIRTAEQMTHTEPGTINPLEPAPVGGTPAPSPTPTRANLPVVAPETIPATWRATPVPPSGGSNVTVYRGFARNAETHMATVVREGEIGGILTRALDTANDAVFNQVERNPVLEGPNMAGVVAITIPAAVWDALVASNSISERGNYPGFSRQLDSTELRVNSVEAGRLINSQDKRILPPDPNFDFRTPF